MITLVVLLVGTIAAGCADGGAAESDRLRLEVRDIRSELEASQEQNEICRAITDALSRELGNAQQKEAVYGRIIEALATGAAYPQAAVDELQRLQGRADVLRQEVIDANGAGGTRSIDCFGTEFAEQVEDIANDADG